MIEDPLKPPSGSPFLEFLRLRPGGRRRDGVLFLVRSVLLTAAGVLFLRSFVITPFFVPSQSMMPSLQSRDFIIAWRWPYASFGGFFTAFGSDRNASDPELPDRGEIIVFSSPAGNGVNYVKRVIGLPGDRISLSNGQVFLNGQPLRLTRLPAYDLPLDHTQGCIQMKGVVDQVVTLSDGSKVCRFKRYLETMPDGESYAVLDIANAISDEMSVITVPAHRLFVLGDNRDNSLDSRFGIEDDGVGLIPVSLVKGEVIALLGVSMNSSKRTMGFRDPSSDP